MTSPGLVSVAIPVRDAGPGFAAVLGAVRTQELDRPIEVVVIDSGSRDGSPELAERLVGARVERIDPASFSHGATRNALMAMARGEHVAFLTQDAQPAHPRWLAELVAGFAAAPDVALTFGPYLPRLGASPMVRRELEEWFALMDPLVRGIPAGPGPRGFFSDVNGAVARWAWERVPYRAVPYAEDRVLAVDMLAQGWAKAYRPGAGVLHSHDYSPIDLLRRSFDEARALREVYGHVAPADPRTVGAEAARRAALDLRWMRRRGRSPRGPRLAAWTARAAGHHLLRGAGSALGARAGRLPPPVRGACSLEGRMTFEPLPWPPVP